MTSTHVVRFLVGLLGVPIVGVSLYEIWTGPSRRMSWAQALRYASWAVIASTIMIAQYFHRDLPITGYTVSFAIGFAMGALGVVPALKRPIPYRRRAAR